MICTIFDIETTGFYNMKYNVVNPDNAEILEVGYIKVESESLDIIDSGTLYFYKPYFNVESEAQQYHKLTRDFLKQYEKDFDDNLKKLYCLFQQTFVVGKNCNEFDIPFIQAFIKKHSNSYLDIDACFKEFDFKDYDDCYFYYHSFFDSYDIQIGFCETWRDWEERRTGVRPKGKRTGRLEEYINVFPEWQGQVDALYDSLPKDRVTRAHGALYDCVMTYVVFKYCVEHGL